jgi:hypothetical protein
MIRALVITAAMTLTASVAQAQGCLGLSDAFGSTTVTCSDGRSGILRTDPTGAVNGMIGNQVFSGTTAGVNPAGAPAGVPYLLAPPPPPLNAPPPPEAPTLAPLAPQFGLTDLQRQYQAERARRLEASRRAAAPGRSTRPAGSGRSGESRD